MPLNPRVRDNNVFGTTDDNPLVVGSTTMNSTGLVNLSVIATKHATLTLDPLRQFGNPEIVLVTVHTAGSSIVTITRGAYGTMAREHPQGTLWVHAPLDEDFIEIVTSSTRPSDPYEGQFIFETDTNKLYGYGGVDWAPRDSGGQLGYSEAVVNAGPTSGTTELTLFTVIATIGTGRRVRISHFEPNNIGTAGADNFSFRIREDGNNRQDITYQVVAGNTQTRTAINTVILTPTAGSHTYTATVTRTSGTGTLTPTRSATVVAFLVVEDIGAA